jgi:hypothetical protein
VRFCLILVACLLPCAGLAGCGAKAPPPTAEEAAKAPPLTPPNGADNSRTVSDK